MADTAASRRFSIDELATLAGVTPRTVRYYVAEGLLDRPEGEKRGAHYLQRHLEQLLRIRRLSGQGASLERIRALRRGAADDPAPRAPRAGTVEVWSRITLADGLELQVEPGRAGLPPEQVRALVRGVTDLFRRIRDGEPPRPDPA